MNQKPSPFVNYAASLAVLVLLFGTASTVQAAAALLAPGSLTATAVSTSAIKLSWVDTNSTETGYSVERSLNATTGWIAIALLSRNVTSYQDGGLASATTYYYRVRASAHSKFSSYSNVASARTQTVATATPIATRTATRTPTPIATATRTVTPAVTATSAPVVTATRTVTPAVTATRTATPVRTATRTPTPVATA